MINTKNMIYLLLIVILTASFTLVSAQYIEVDDVKFNIPDGFEEDMDKSEVIKDSTGTTYVEIYSNTDSQKIIINVLSPNSGKYNLPVNEAGYENKTINGINGIYNKDITEFIYLNDEKLISISTHNETLLEEVLIDEK